MRRTLATCACIIAVVVPGRTSVAKDPTPQRVLLIGDSITSGVVSEPEGLSYADRLRELLGPDYEVAILAKGGVTSQDWIGPDFLAWLEPEIPATIVSILLGTNDALRTRRGARNSPPVEPDAYERAIRKLVGTLVEAGAQAVILMTPPSHHSPGAIPMLSRYRRRIQTLCASVPGAVCGPDLFSLLDVSDFAPGNIHPNASGHGKIALALADAIRAVALGPERSVR